ncbi:MAG: Flp family type IVb pilin [Chloroflexota bacterium]
MESIPRDPLWLGVRRQAQGLVEYGLIIALVAVLAIAGLVVFGPAVSRLLSRLGGSI